MILYDLRCEAGHDFEGWFPGSEAFARQRDLGLLACPQCGGSRVGQALSAPAVVTRRASRAPDTALPDAARSALQKLRAAVETHCEHVGADFAEEAMRIDRGSAPARGIYGDATPEERERLADAGIEIVTIPWVPRADG